MNKIKAFLSKKRIKSLYVKWLLMFAAIIFMAQLFTLGAVIYLVFPTISTSFSEKLYRKAEFMQDLHGQGVELTEDTLTTIGDFDIQLILLEDDHIPEDIGIYDDIISLKMIQRAMDGEIVSSYSKESLNEMPFCLVSIGDKLALLVPNIHNNEMSNFELGLDKVLILSSIFASLLMVIVLAIIIRPIKKVTAASKEVAKGNFDIELKTNSVDEIGQLVQNYNLMAKELKKNEYLKKDFVSSVSHEFRTPITSIEGFTRLLKSKDLTAKQFDEYTDIIISETGRLANLSSNLLKLSVLDSSGMELTKTDFFLDEQIRNVVLLLERQWEIKDLEFDIEMKDVKIHANEELLSQVWINLIQNAIKFSPFGETITITLKDTEGAIFVSIADKGPGISLAHQDKIFDRFYKVDKSRSRRGNGLGLSIVKRILDLSKANITINSDLGEGTEFIVTLPKAVENENSKSNK